MLIGPHAQGGVFGTSPVDDEKDAYLLSLLECYAEDHAKTMRWEHSHVEGFMKFLFEAKTLLAASFINLG